MNEWKLLVAISLSVLGSRRRRKLSVDVLGADVKVTRDATTQSDCHHEKREESQCDMEREGKARIIREGQAQQYRQGRPGMG